MNLKERAKQLKVDIPAIFLALGKKETPLAAKILAGITIAYALSPIDLIPDFLPIIGYLDDLIILPALIALTIRLIPEEELRACKIQSQDLWKNGKPKNWLFAIPIILIWAVCIFFIVRALSAIL